MIPDEAWFCIALALIPIVVMAKLSDWPMREAKR